MKLKSLLLLLAAIAFISCNDSTASKVSTTLGIISTDTTNTSGTTGTTGTSSTAGTGTNTLAVTYDESLGKISLIQGSKLDTIYKNFVIKSGTSTVDASKTTITGIDTTKAGQYDAKITYSGISTTVKVNVGTPDLSYKYENNHFYVEDPEDSAKKEACKLLTSIIIPQYVTYTGYSDGIHETEQIRTSTFDSYTNLVTLIMSNTIKTIDEKAFNKNSALENITFSSTLEEIGRAAFNGDKALTSIELPKTMTLISDLAFGGCTSLNAITLYDNFNPAVTKTTDKGYAAIGISADAFLSVPKTCVVTIKSSGAATTYTSELKSYFTGLGFTVK